MPAHPPDRIEIRAADDGAGAIVVFPYDASLAQRFRTRFPGARWSDEASEWFVPGTTAERRVALWLQRAMPEPLAFADERGRDAFAFDPIESDYLEATEALLVRTPFSRTVIDHLRGVPWAAWDSAATGWRVPYRSQEALRSRWLSIEIAAQRAEPSERRRRREELKRSPEFAGIRQREAERRRKRLAAPASQLPRPGRPIMTAGGIVVITGSDGELVDVGGIIEIQPGMFASYGARLPLRSSSAHGRHGGLPIQLNEPEGGRNQTSRIYARPAGKPGRSNARPRRGQRVRRHKAWIRRASLPEISPSG